MARRVNAPWRSDSLAAAVPEGEDDVPKPSKPRPSAARANGVHAPGDNPPLRETLPHLRPVWTPAAWAKAPDKTSPDDEPEPDGAGDEAEVVEEAEEDWQEEESEAHLWEDAPPAEQEQPSGDDLPKEEEEEHPEEEVQPDDIVDEGQASDKEVVQEPEAEVPLETRIAQLLGKTLGKPTDTDGGRGRAARRSRARESDTGTDEDAEERRRRKRGRKERRRRACNGRGVDGQPAIIDYVFCPEPVKLSQDKRDVIERMRARLEITVDSEAGANCKPVSNFYELEVMPDYLADALLAWHLDQTTPMQAQALPVILAGHDVIGVAESGSGKTLAFMIPAVMHAEAQQPQEQGRHATAMPSALVLAPTREQAIQIGEEGKKLLFKSTGGPRYGSVNHPGGLWASSVYGGQHRAEKLGELKHGCHILAATPPHLLELLEGGDVSLERVTYFVVDEANQMLDDPLREDVNQIATHLRPDRQTVVFSPTLPENVRKHAVALCSRDDSNWRGPARIFVGQLEEPPVQGTASVKQEVVVFDQETWELRDEAKQRMLYAHLRHVMRKPSNKTVVFVNSKTFANELSYNLGRDGFKCNALHGGQTRHYRTQMLDEFMRGASRLLVATDVVGKTFELPDVTHIVIFDFGDVEDYIHRVGRIPGGHSLAMFEYSPKWPNIPGELVRALEEAAQPVPPELMTLVTGVMLGEKKVAAKIGPGNPSKRRKTPWGFEEQPDSNVLPPGGAVRAGGVAGRGGAGGPGARKPGPPMTGRPIDSWEEL